MRRLLLANKELQQTGFSVAALPLALWRPRLNGGTLCGRAAPPRL